MHGRYRRKTQQIFYWQLTFMERDREFVSIDWSQARRSIERHLLPDIAVTKKDSNHEIIQKIVRPLHDAPKGRDSIKSLNL